MGFFDFLTKEIAIDLGTTNFLIVQQDKIVVNEPSVVAFSRSSGKVVAIGRKALEIEAENREDIRIVRPLKGGVIADFQAAEQMIKGMLELIDGGRKHFWNTFRMVICVPVGTTEVEKRAIRGSAAVSGAREVFLIHEPIAAALGMGLDVEQPTGHMVIDIGGGISEAAVIALSGIVCDESVRIGGDNFDLDIMQYIRQQFNVQIGQATAEKLKKEVGAALVDLPDPPDDVTIHGHDLITGLPKEVKVSYLDVVNCLERSLAKIEGAILKTLESTPPELSADIHQAGIHLTGGGSMLRGLDIRIATKTRLPVRVVENPLYAVVKGTGIALQNIDHCKFLIR